MNKLLCVALMVVSGVSFSYGYGDSPADENRMIDERVAIEQGLQNNMMRDELNRQEMQRIINR